MRVPKAADMSGVAQGVGATTCRVPVQNLLSREHPLKIETPGVYLVPGRRSICTSARTDAAISASMSVDAR